MPRLVVTRKSNEKMVFRVPTSDGGYQLIQVGIELDYHGKVKVICEADKSVDIWRREIVPEDVLPKADPTGRPL